MRVELNQELVNRKRKHAQYLFFISMGILIASFVIINPQLITGQTTEPDFFMAVILPTLVLPIALVVTLASVNMTNQWIRQPRPEHLLQEGIKGLSNKSVLYQFYHSPANHVLICPQGVFAIVTRYQNGTHRVNGDSWSTDSSFFGRLLRVFRRDGIGDPTKEAREAAAHVQGLIAPIAPEVTVQPLIVFTDSTAQIIAENPTVPVLFANPKTEPNLIDYMRKLPKEGYQTLTREQIAAFEAATLPQSEG